MTKMNLSTEECSVIESYGFSSLRSFVEVVRQGGFSQAAKVVFTTQSTVSKAVKQLETELGVALLDRRGHRSMLTAEGDVVYRRALKILAERDDLAAELDELRGLKLGTLRLVFRQVAAATCSRPFLRFIVAVIPASKSVCCGIGYRLSAADGR